MNKLYIIICAIVLSGCEDTSNLQTVEVYNKAEKYCTDNKAQLSRFYGSFICKKNDVPLQIPKEALK